MGNLTRYGFIEADVPRTAGKVLYVANAAEYRANGRVYKASDVHTGLQLSKAMLTLNAAMAKCSANAGDTIVLLPGIHTMTVSLAASVAGVTVTGLSTGTANFINPRAILTTSAADEVVNVTAADVTFENIRFTVVTAQTGVDFSVAANRLYFKDCFFSLIATASTSTKGLVALGAASEVVVDHCVVSAAGAQGPAFDMTATLDSIIQNTLVLQSSGTWANCILVGAATDRLLIRDCDFQTSGTLTAAIDGTGATIASGVQVMRCIIGTRATVPIDNFDAGECELANNYTANNGTPGGTLIVAIT